MATRKDLLKAQSFTTKRLVSALVDRNPDDPIFSLRRSNTAGFVSVMLGVVLLAGSTLFGMFKPGSSDSWRDDKKVIHDYDSGVLFAYSKDGDKEMLTPMSDITSARLMVASRDAKSTPTSITVKSSKLKGIPQGPMRGIPGAPRQLPPPSEMAPYPIKVCSTAPRSDGHRFLTIEVGQGKVPSSSVTIVAQDAGGNQYMILQGKSHRLWQPTRGGDSPLKENIPLVSAGNAWLSSVPAGEPILPLKVDKKGQVPSAHRVSQMLVGQIAMVPGDAATQPRYYVQLFDGLARTTYLDMRAMQSSDDQLGDPVRITNTQAANSISATMPELMTRGIPDGKPVGPEGYVSLRDSSVCLTYTEAAGQNPLISIGDETPPIPVGLSRPAMSLADVVSMAQVKGALVANVNTSGPDHASFLITGGLRYGLPTGWARRAIGYGDNVPVAKVNADLIKLIPNGLSQGAQLDKSSIKELR